MFFSPGGGMVDAVDLKSIGRKAVRVRVPPRAPHLFIRTFTLGQLYVSPLK